jgi:hypothetical protein
LTSTFSQSMPVYRTVPTLLIAQHAQ